MTAESVLSLWFRPKAQGSRSPVMQGWAMRRGVTLTQPDPALTVPRTGGRTCSRPSGLTWGRQVTRTLSLFTPAESL